MNFFGKKMVCDGWNVKSHDAISVELVSINTGIAGEQPALFNLCDACQIRANKHLGPKNKIQLRTTYN